METRKIKTPLGKEVEIKSYITAGERNQLRRVFLESMQLDPVTNQIKEIKGSVIDEAEKRLIELVVVSYDGSSENVYQRIQESTPEEYDFIVNECNKISSGGFQRAK